MSNTRPNPFFKEKHTKKSDVNPIDWHLDRPLTADELAGFGKQKPKPRSIQPFIKFEKKRKLCTVVGIKGTF